MTEYIVVENDGPRIVSSTYWGSSWERSGYLYVTLNDGTVRMLMPRGSEAIVKDLARGCRYAILSRGPWPDRDVPEAVEILFEDGSDTPFSFHLTPESFDVLPKEPPAGREWRLSVWTHGPRCAGEWPCRWRRVPRLPWLKPWRKQT